MMPIAVKVVSPVVPTTKREMQELIEDLSRMRCQGLHSRPWLLRNEAMVRESVEGSDNRWENLIQGHPTQWTTNMWAEIYEFD